MRFPVRTGVAAACLMLALVVGCKDDITGDGSSDVVFNLGDVRYSQVERLLNQSCSFSPCHSSDRPAAGVNLTSYFDLKQSGIVVPGDTSLSLMYIRVAAKNTSPMPPTPYKRLTSNQIAGIGVWIMKGALNN